MHHEPLLVFPGSTSRSAAAERDARAGRGSGEEPRVTVIVLHWGSEDDTRACLRSLESSDYPALDILLVDNGSLDGSGARLRTAFPRATFLQNDENLGFTGGNNRGIEQALARGCDYVLLLNNDTVIEKDGVSQLLHAARSLPRVGAVGPKILFYDAPERIWFAGGELSRLRAVGVHWREGEIDVDPAEQDFREVSFLSGCCLLLPAAVLREVGGFEEDFFAYIEDVDLSFRLAGAGYRLLYQPAARVLHRVPLVSEPSPFQIFHRDRNRRRLVRRRYGWGDRVLFALFFYPSRILRAAQYLLKRDLARATAIWQGMTAR